MSEVLKKFGRYFLLDRIAQGGMAEIYRARLASTDGVSRLLVIKRIQQGYGSNEEFVTMFRSEIKVTMGFNHPNIVQTFDYGEEEGQPFIAMEFVDGRNLRQFLQRYNEQKRGLPIDLACYIIEQAAAGLDYAHGFKDKISGESLDIIHRDISPQNILISFEGHVKVIDFGIAKATTNSESTRAGIIKGKPAYLSPEQISGLELDGRCDVFALGAVLWELLTGRKLFAGDNDLAVLKMIEACSTTVKPPSTINADVAKELDYIVLKSLAKEREKRFQSAEEFRRALHKFVYAFNPDFNPADLSHHAKDLFKHEIVEDRKRLGKLNDRAEALLRSGDSNGAPGGPEAGQQAGPKEDTTTVYDTRARGQQMVALQTSASIRLDRTKGGVAAPKQPVDPSEATANARRVFQGTGSIAAPAPGAMSRGSSATITRRAESSSGFGTLIFAASLLAALAGYLGPSVGFEVPVLSALMGRKSSVPKTASIQLQGNQKSVEVLIDGKVVATELPATVREVAVSAPVSLVVRGAAGTFRQVLTLQPGESRNIGIVLTGGLPSNLSLGEDNRLLKLIQLKLAVQPQLNATDSKITIDGKPVDPAGGMIQVPMDRTVELVVEKKGYKPMRREFVANSAQLSGQREFPMEVTLEPERFGFVSIRTTPSSDAYLSMRDGARSPSSDKPLVLKTPIENEKLPIGTYQVRLVNEVLGMEKTVTISVQEGRAIRIEERLLLNKN